jgi:hypothetical protein
VDLQYGTEARLLDRLVDQQHCHNFRDDLWDRTNGRIYRMSWAETYKPSR